MPWLPPSAFILIIEPLESQVVMPNLFQSCTPSTIAQSCWLRETWTKTSRTCICLEVQVSGASSASNLKIGSIGQQTTQSVTTTGGAGTYIVIIQALNETDVSGRTSISSVTTNNGTLTAITSGEEFNGSGINAQCRNAIYLLKCTANATVSFYGSYKVRGMCFKIS